ncbi:transcription elongation factor SPT6, partial [Brachionus plicatilis]
DGHERAHAQKKKRMFADDAQQEALDIFGVNADELGVASDDERNEDDKEDEDDDEEDEADYDDDETYERAAKKRHRLKTMHKIEDIFEPQELEKNLLTELDQQIRIEDKPERFMLRQVAVSGEPDELQLEREALWIFNTALTHLHAPHDKQLEEERIGRVKETLNFIRNELFEVPFIAQYRKEHYEPHLSPADLWTIYHMDEKYCQLSMRKLNLCRLLERMHSYFDSTGVQPHRPIDPLDFERVKNVTSIDEFLDCYHHFHLHYNSDLTAMKEHEMAAKRANTDLDLDLDDFKFTKQASKKDAFNYCKSMGLGRLAARFGLSAEKYAQNLHLDYTKYELEQEPVEPEQLAQEFVQEPFESVEQVLAMTRYMVAVQFAKEPAIRAYFRDLYMQRVCVNVRPSANRGLNEIDETHACYPFKYLKMKPVRQIKHDEWLKMCQAEQDGLLIVSFECSPFDHSRPDDKEDWDETAAPPATNLADNKSVTIVDKLKSFYQKDEFSYNVEQWNKQRALIVDEMCGKFLMPEMERELKSRLASDAKQYVFKQCCDKLESMLSVAPYNPTIDDGALNQFIYLKKLQVRSRDHGEMRQKHDDEMQKLQTFIETKRPRLIVIAAENKDALFLQEELTEMVKKLGLGVGVELVDNEVAKLCTASKVCEQEWQVSVPTLVRHAVYLARYVQDPMLCMAQLCNQDRDLLGLKLHPMMQYVISASGSRSSDDSSQLLRQLEVKFINVVNDVGVDLNRCDVEPHSSGVLQFVCGLGPRKAAHILKVLRAERLELKGKLTNKELSTYPVFPNRLCLVTKCSLGRKVFINCSGFIKLDVDKISKEIDEDDEENQDEANYTDPLDSTRIHLESYEWAKKIAIDALDLDENSEAANSRTALKEILENPRRLKDLDLDAFAKELMRTGYGNKRTTLYDIRQELFYRYRDKRVPFTPMDPVQRFYTLIHETPDTFNKGKLITCRVTGISRRRPTKEQLDAANPVKDDNTGMWKCTFCQKNDFNEIGKVWAHFDTDECPGPPVGVRTMLENGCQGFISLRNLSDNQVSNPEDRIKAGMIIHARIRDLDPQKFRVDLISRTSDLRDEAQKWKPTKDPYYDYRSAQEDRERLDEKKKRDLHKQVYTKRVIDHPHFKNVGYAEAVTMLNEGDVGDAIVRPSSKGTDHLTLTWKVGPGCYQHVDILEEKKANSFSLGKKLVIQGDDYEDLDEILARFINPMVQLVRDIMSNKYFKNLNELDIKDEIKVELVERYLLDERQKQPNKIPYVFLQCVNLPCKFMLAYVIKHKMRCEYLSVTSEGFRFRQKIQPMQTDDAANTSKDRADFEPARARSGFGDRERGARGGPRGGMRPRGGFDRGRGARGANRAGYGGTRDHFRTNTDWNADNRRHKDDDWDEGGSRAPSNNWKSTPHEPSKDDYVPRPSSPLPPPPPPTRPQAVINNDDEMWD